MRSTSRTCSVPTIFGFQSHNDESYVRILAALNARRRALSKVRVGGVTTLEGDWSNVFANVLAKAEAGSLTIAIKSRLSYPHENRGEVDCAATVTAAPGTDGWYSAAVGDKDHEGRLDIIRFRLQGTTLRIVHA